MTTAVSPAPPQILQYLNNQGQLNVGGSILTQVGGVNAATYEDATGTTALPNPIPLNSRGEISNAVGLSRQLFLVNGSTYTFTMFDAAGNQLNQATSVTGSGTALASAIAGLLSSFAASAGATLMGWIQAGVGAILRTLQDKARERVSVLDYAGVDPTGATDSTAGLNAFMTYVAANATRVRGIFPNGIYQYSVSPNFAIQNADFVAEGEVHLHYTGTGNALIFDAGSGSQNVNNVKFQGNFIVEAPSTALNGIYVRGVHRSVIEARVRGCGSTSAGLRVEFSVCTTYRVRVTGPTEDSWYSAFPPLNGYYITRRGTGENTSACSFDAPIVENVAGDGITIDYAWQNQFFVGTVENTAGIGVVCTTNSQRNAFYGTDLENNVSALNDAGLGNSYYSILAGSPGATVTITGNLSTHIGGFYDAIVDNGGGTVLDSILYSNNGGSITGTGVGRAKRSVYNVANVKFDFDQTATTLFASVSVPNNAATTVLTLPATGNTYYQIGAYLAGAGAAATYGAYALIYQDGNTAVILSQTNAASLTITRSGQAVQVTQTSGVSQTVSAFARPI